MTQPVVLRNMEAADLGQVNLVLSKAFSKARIQDGYADWHVPLCRIGFLQMYLRANPEGCYVAERRGQVVGYVFSRRWGRIGWFGPLSVTPEEAGKGIGKRLVQAVIDHLREAGADTIGLETNPRSYRNLAFYTKMDFEPARLAVDVGRELTRGVGGLPPGYQAVRLGRASSDETAKLRATLHELTDDVCPGLDYRAEAELIINHSYGDALLLFDAGAPVGAALAHTEPYTEKEERSFLKVFVLMLHPSRSAGDLRHLLAALEIWAREEFLRGLTLRVIPRQGGVLRSLLDSGFNIVHTDFRMVLRGYEEREAPEAIHFSKWE